MTETVVLIGRGIGYSASPAMLSAAFAACALDWRYSLCDVEASELAAVLARLRSAELRGANVTQPHKAAVRPHVDSVTADVDRVDAVNTVVRAADGSLAGHTTDLPALADEIDGLGGPVRRAVILGRGGAARTAAAVLTDRGAEVALVGRADWAGLEELLAGADLLVNATPIGTGGDDAPVPRMLLRPDLAVLDLVYRPSPSDLVAKAREAGAVARGGAGMLLGQAARSFTLWTGLEAPLDAMREALRSELGAAADV
jgi:shikimate dehydrogenase